MIDVESRVHGRGDYLWGSFVRVPGVDGYIVATNPGDRSDVLGRFAFAASAVDEAVGAAREGVAPWEALGLDARVHAVRRLADRLDEASDDLARLVVRETGRALWEARAEITAASRGVRALADDAPSRLGRGTIREGVAGHDSRPLGVVAIVSSFALPVLGPTTQVASALLGGNTVVVKPSKFAPGTGQALALLVDRLKLPRGVFNLVQGTGSSVGARLASHPGVDAVLLSGRRETAARVRAAAAARPELTVLAQCADKGAAIVLADADLDLAVHEIAVSAWANAGQRPDATARVIVAAERLDAFCDKLAARARAARWGYGLDPGVLYGPMIAESARRAYRHALQDASSRGWGTLVAGGPVEHDTRRGAYVRPSVILVPRAEGLDLPVPGPAIRVWTARDVDEAVALHEGLSSRPATAVFTSDEGRLETFRRRLTAGTLWWNRAPSPYAPRLAGVSRGAGAGGLPPFLDLPVALVTRQLWVVERRTYDSARLARASGPMPASRISASDSLES